MRASQFPLRQSTTVNRRRPQRAFLSLPEKCVQIVGGHNGGTSHRLLLALCVFVIIVLYFIYLYQQLLDLASFGLTAVVMNALHTDLPRDSVYIARLLRSIGAFESGDSVHDLIDFICIYSL